MICFLRIFSFIEPFETILRNKLKVGMNDHNSIKFIYPQIYEDSIVLHSVFTNARERLEKDGSLPTPVASEDDEATEPEDGGDDDEDSKLFC